MVKIDYNLLSSMKVGIDISPIVYETGVSWYTKNLVKALLKIDKTDEFVLFGGSLRRLKKLGTALSNYHTTPIPQKGIGQAVRGSYSVKALPIPPTLADFLWNRLHVFPIEWLIGKVDVFHSSDWTQPPSRAYKVTTIHDLVPLRFPEISHPKIVGAHKARLKWVKKEVDKIIAVSEFTKKEIVELLDIDPTRIAVIHEAPDSDVKPIGKEKIEKTKKRLGISGDYLLVVGTDPRKNIPAIIQAYRKVCRHMTGTDLVIAGKPWGSIPDTEGVNVLGHVKRKELVSLYSGAQALIYTSLYEGFGLPILEAMQVGCPVVTSNISSMPEVAGDAAVLVDPRVPGEIVAGIEKVISDRKKWVERGKKHVKQFSWEKTAKQTLEVYKREL